MTALSLLILLSLPCHAQRRMIAEGLAASNDAIFISTANKQVSIGTGTPNAPFHVVEGVGAVSAVDSNKIVEIESDNNANNMHLNVPAGATNISWIFDVAGVAQHGLTYSVSGDYAALTNSGSSGSPTSGLIVDGSGNVGVGTSAPAKPLQVIGDIRVGTSGTNGCLERFDGAALVGSCASDARLKTNPVPLANILGKLVKLRPVAYIWHDPRKAPAVSASTSVVVQPVTEPRQAIGLIAQQVEPFFPELVSENSDGYKQVAYGIEIEMFLIQAIKELDEKVRILEKKLMDLEGR